MLGPPGEDSTLKVIGISLSNVCAGPRVSRAGMGWVMGVHSRDARRQRNTFLMILFIYFALLCFFWDLTRRTLVPKTILDIILF